MTSQETDNIHKDEAAHGVGHKLRQVSLRAAGIGCMIADIALITSGFMTGHGKIGAAGAFGLTAGFVGARYGNPKAEKQLEQITRHLGEYLRKEGVEIPENPTTESLTKEGGLLDHIESFLYSHPSQVMNVFYSLIGIQFLRSGFQHKDYALAGGGGCLITGGLAGILLQEKKPDPNHPPEGALQKAWSWVQEKPLRLTGTLFNANLIGLGMSALKDRHDNPAQKAYLLKMLAVAGFAFGNTMIALSSKSETGGRKMDAKTLNELANASAAVIAAQPKELQDALLEHIAGFLSSQPLMQMDAPQISKLLHDKMTEVANTQAPAGWQQRVSNTSNAQSQPTL